ncbi:storkhead-box protein 1 [Plakobranchus ocellatus]|uniref:Storkhead-box protein 1 n=1 Tax=Plakobranchus ocellatus TaxID=259542 RepID=A0AAV3ZWL5_9GAST|nr:storkhead-box protein 1 [Plakobranchus ocellatus]
MSHKYTREEGKANPSKNLPVVSKCLVIVLIPKTKRNSEDTLDQEDAANSTITDANIGEFIRPSEIHKAPNSNSNGYNGKELLHNFKMINKTCYWNPSLVESIKGLEYKGFVEPSTILVTGADIHLENLRSAWGRRVLKAPSGFTIDRIGDVNGIEMQVIPQTQFMPLPDAICSVLLDLNTRGVTATLEVILEKLAMWYRHMNVPSHQLVFDSLGQLIKDRKVFHTGSGYFVVTPDTSRLHTSWAANSSYVPSNASWLPYHPMYVPVFQGQMATPTQLQASRAHMRSISCQVTTIEDSDNDDDEDVAVRAKDREKERTSTLGRAPRSSSLGRTKDGKDKKGSVERAGGKVATAAESNSGQFRRTASLKEDKGKSGKEATLKLATAPPEKEKEKTSIFSKIFGRKKKERDKVLMPPPPAPPPLKHPPAPPSSTSGSDMHSEGREPKEKEYATFSAQFPPPEWMWYQQQLEKQKRTESWVTFQTNKTSTAVTGSGQILTGAKITSRPPMPTKSSHHYTSSHRKSLISLHHGHENYVPMGATNLGDGLHMVPHGIDMIKTSMDVNKARSIRPDNLYESFHNPPPLPRSRDHYLRKSRDFDNRKNHQHHHRHTVEQRQSEYDVIDNPGDVTPLHTSNVYHSVSALSPVTPFNDDGSTYAKLAMQQPHLGPLHSTPRVNTVGHSERTTYQVEGHEARDRIYGSTSQGHHRQRSSKAHRSRRKAQQRIYSYYTGGNGAGSDISYEYKGKLPNKNSSRAQSRDSGVNCVGLGKTAAQNKGKGPSDPVYENTDKSDKPQLQSDLVKSVPPNHVHFERTAGGAEEANMSHPAYSGDITNQAYNSVVYGMDSTNQAYNSVVYGSSSVVTDIGGGPSVMYGTIASSHLDGSEVGVPKNSLQSGYYNDIEDSSVPASALITCQVEINPTAHASQAEELHSRPESLVDVICASSPGVREVSGSSDGVVEVAAVGEDNKQGSDGDIESSSEENATALQYQREGVAGHDGDDEHTEDEGEEYNVSNQPLHNSFSEDTPEAGPVKDCVAKIIKHSEPGQIISDQPEGGTSSEMPPPPAPNGTSSQRENCSNGVSGFRDQFVSDSGFSSPRNPEGATSNGSHTSSFGQEGRESWHQAHRNGAAVRQQHGNDEVVGSSDGGLHNNGSDVNMVSSEHHSGSTTNGDSSCDTQSYSYPYNDHNGSQLSHRTSKSYPQSLLVPVPSSSFQPPKGPVQYLQPQPQQLSQNIIHMYQPSAMVVPHPDIYNNNNSNSASMYVPLHSNTAVLNSQRQPISATKVKYSERQGSVDLWKQNSTSNELHKFEEEQLTKKYGVNGEFEVMGVL